MGLNVDIGRFLGYGQDTELLRPLYRSAVRLLSRGHEDEAQISPPPEEAAESAAQSQAMNAAPGLSENEPPQGPSEEAALQQDGAPEQVEAPEEPFAPDLADSALDIFTTEKIDDEEQQDLPQGLVEIDAHALLADCEGVVARLRGTAVRR